MAPRRLVDDTVWPRIGLAFAVSVMAGILTAGVAFPFVGSVALVAKAGADDFLSLPSELSDPTLAQRSRILAADGSVLATLYLENRVNVALQDVPVLAREALIAIEDNRFYAHNGVDVKGTLRAAIRNGASGSVQQGGSTLTQQYVKNVLLATAAHPTDQQAARSRTLDRKLREARYALALEHRYTKDQILERYLNIAYYGNGVYGIGTAASYYFGLPVQKLSLAQGAMFAGMVQNPRGYDPDPSRGPKVRAALIARRNTVLARMSALGFITRQQEIAAAAEPIKTHIRKVGNGCEAPTVRAPFFCDYIRKLLEEDTPLGNVLGSNRTQRQQRLLGGGLTIHTSLDPSIQLAAQVALDQQVPRNDPTQPTPDKVASVADVVEPATGAIKAMAVDRTYGDGPGQTKVNLAIGGQAGFQGGSTFKVFELTAALQMGLPTSLTLYAPQRYSSRVFTDCTGGCHPYTPSNAGDSEAGTFDMVRATHDSVNTYFVQLEERTGTERPASLAESLGVHQFQAGFPHAPLLRGGAFTLGANEVSPLDMAGAYATYAAHGLFCPPRAITGIDDAQGVAIKIPDQQCTQVLDPGIADTVTSILRGVIDGSTPGRTGKAASIGRPAAGKTGTTNNSRAAWFIGYTPQLATAVWVGKVSYKTADGLQNITINGQFYKQLFGGSLPAPIWAQIMSQALANTPVVDFSGAAAGAGQMQLVGIPDVRGLPPDAARRALLAAGFAVVQGGSVAAAPLPAGAVAGTLPTAGTTAPQGSTVTILVSNGQTPAPAPQATASPRPSPRASRTSAPTGPTAAPAPTPAPTPSRSP